MQCYFCLKIFSDKQICLLLINLASANLLKYEQKVAIFFGKIHHQWPLLQLLIEEAMTLLTSETSEMSKNSPSWY